MEANTGSEYGNHLFTIPGKVKNISKFAIKSVVSILKAIGIVSILIGLLLIAVLCLVFI